MADTETPVIPRPTCDEVINAVCEVFGVSSVEMRSDCRARSIARPRQVAMHLMRKMTIRSTPEIGRALGWRDHSTVLWGIHRIETLRHTDADLSVMIERASLLAETSAARRWFDWMGEFGHESA